MSSGVKYITFRSPKLNTQRYPLREAIIMEKEVSENSKFCVSHGDSLKSESFFNMLRRYLSPSVPLGPQISFDSSHLGCWIGLYQYFVPFDCFPQTFKLADSETTCRNALLIFNSTTLNHITSMGSVFIFILKSAYLTDMFRPGF